MEHIFWKGEFAGENGRIRPIRPIRPLKRAKIANSPNSPRIRVISRAKTVILREREKKHLGEILSEKS